MPYTLDFCIGRRPAIKLTGRGVPGPVGAGECAHPSRIRRRFRPFIEDVDDRLPDLIPRVIDVRRIPLLKGLFSDTALSLEAIRLEVVAIPGRERVHALPLRVRTHVSGQESGQPWHGLMILPKTALPPHPSGIAHPVRTNCSTKLGSMVSFRYSSEDDE
jgi:hypothetical protein